MKFRWSKKVAASEAQAWEDRLFALEVENVAISGMPGGQQLLEAFCETRAEAETFRERFGGAVAEFVDQNWAALGLAGARRRVIKIRDRMIVTLDDDPDFLDELRAANPGRELLIFPPEMAFGTGDHATTATCLRFLVRLKNGAASGWSLLDLGTGTGILSVAARKLGAGRIVATDYDPKAIAVAEGSFRRHGIDPKTIDLRQEDIFEWRPKSKFDVVLANLFSDVLIGNMAKIEASVARGGIVILSGILRQQLPEVASAARGAGLEPVEIVNLGRWSTIHVCPGTI